MKRIEFLWKYERYFFALFVLFTAVPVLFNTYFPTVDGPAHLHNANLLKHLWFLNNDFALIVECGGIDFGRAEKVLHHIKIYQFNIVIQGDMETVFFDI